MKNNGAPTQNKSVQFHARLVAGPRCRRNRGFARVDNERVISPVQPPWADWHLPFIDKPPVGDIRVSHPKIIAHRGGNIQTRPFVHIRFWPVISEYIFPMIGPKWTAILPLGVNRAGAMADRHPVTMANGFALSCKTRLEPRDDERRFRLHMAIAYVVVRKSDIERILTRDKPGGNVPAPIARIRGIVTAISLCPMIIPCANAIGSGILFCGGFSHPKRRGHDSAFPRAIGILASSRHRRDFNLRFNQRSCLFLFIDAARF